ncbi:MAG: Acylphosphatase [Candidatus Beckwithbacteria bacterium GW2011_GWA2_43_10]|uniref:acylphosphatase n=1 Tax=Candidatus Beckwithbacteria bacterium GW2011_GWA2_43_10 TaxID=1618369 RepID=A0A0G1C286_9BACT|nr:MAG: Acylphosphatase [Candidatus Beckwithbacteria bacterium GW2011_GWA2_43_10]
MTKAHILISGQVQGVGFRFWVRGKFKELGISGWVENTDDGRVEAEFSGSAKQNLEMIKLCKQGPPLASVKKVAILKSDD